jgi:tetratricopeptide (TPR) repeat protein
MFRYLVLLCSCLLCCVWSVAQNPAEEPTGLALNNSALNSKKISDARSARPIDARISIRRLKVSHKARRLYEKALDAWGRHAYADAQKKVDEALRLDPIFPEALTLLGGIQAADQQWSSAEQNLRAAIGSDPSFSPAYIILAGVYNTQERYEEAREAAEHALEAGTATWAVQYEIARADRQAPVSERACDFRSRATLEPWKPDASGKGARDVRAAKVSGSRRGTKDLSSR